MDIVEVSKFIHNKAKELGYKKLENIIVGRNNRLSSCLGRCYYNTSTGEPTQIEISGKLLDHAKYEEDIKQVALHELAHAMVHIDYPDKKLLPHQSQEFKDACKKLGCTHIGATNNVEFINDTAAFAASNYKYVVECPTCGAQWFYKTNCKSVQNASRYLCGKCKTNLESRCLV